MPTTAATPIERATRLLAWFDEAGRDWPWRQTRDPWRILVSEVCLQQTQVERAARHVEQLLAAYPTPDAMAAAPLAEVLALWQGLGYPRRARNLQLAARHVVDHGWPEPERYVDLPGVGPYTAAALQCFAHELPVVPPDINTRRVLARLFDGDVPAAADHPLLHERAWAWGQAVMELGQRVCRAKAQCEVCPLADACPPAGTPEVIASPRQKRYAGSMRQRRGDLLRALTVDGEVPVGRDEDAARSLVADGLAAMSVDGALLLPAELD
jgi:A/G-specific adenine glycosylase